MNDSVFSIVNKIGEGKNNIPQNKVIISTSGASEYYMQNIFKDYKPLIKVDPWDDPNYALTNFLGKALSFACLSAKEIGNYYLYILGEGYYFDI